MCSQCGYLLYEESRKWTCSLWYNGYQKYHDMADFSLNVFNRYHSCLACSDCTSTTFIRSGMGSDIYVFGFFLNWLFGNAQFLLFEDPQLSIGYCFIWSAAASFSPKYFSVILISYLFVFFTSPLIITTPLLIVLQALTFFEVFGYSSPSEVQFSQLI